MPTDAEADERVGEVAIVQEGVNDCVGIDEILGWSVWVVFVGAGMGVST